MNFLLFCGSDHNLSSFEIHAQLPQATEQSKGVFLLQFDDDNQAIAIVSRLGSAIKLLRQVESPEYSSSTFSFTDLDDKTSNLLANKEIKEKLGPTSRFILSDTELGLAPLVIKKQKVEEIIKLQGFFYKTIWIHDFEHWITKDRKLPGVDAHAGMLPPKVARILINLAGISNPVNTTMLDPFCGTGRLLIEGLELGFKVIGSDTSTSQISATNQNLQFLRSDPAKYQVFQADATTISHQIQASTVDFVVTEPFMGQPNPREDKIKNIYRGLKRLYLGALKDWVTILKPGGKVVMIFPQIIGSKNIYKTSEVVDDPHLLGYNVKSRGIMYSRPGANVLREIIILEKI